MQERLQCQRKGALFFAVETAPTKKQRIYVGGTLVPKKMYLFSKLDEKFEV